MRKTTSAIFVALLAILSTACSADPADAPPAANSPGRAAEPAPSSAPAAQATGSVGLQLTLPDGSQVAVVSWTITGPDNSATVVQTGSVNVRQSGGAMFQVSNIVAGTGYRVALSATSVDGGIACEGAASFDVIARATSQVSVQLACNAAGAGSHTTLVNGTSFDCAAWNSVTASPSETAVGTPVSLGATATGPVPAKLTYEWSAPSGRLGNASAPNTSFVCTVPGPVNVTLVVGDGEVPEGSTCNPALDTDVITITCTGTAPPPPPAAPAMPPWGPIALGTGLLGVGAWKNRRPLAALPRAG
jgi:hypothetical protein